MKKYIVFLLALLAGCATVPPTARTLKININALPEYATDLAMIEGSQISEQNKSIARGLTLRHYSYKENLKLYGDSLKMVVRKNTRWNDNFGTTNEIIAAAGGLSAFFANPNFAVASGLWNVFGLTIKSSNIKPILDRGNIQLEGLQELNSLFSTPRSSFVEFVTATNSDAADSSFHAWRKIEDDLNNRNANFFGEPAK